MWGDGGVGSDAVRGETRSFGGIHSGIHHFAHLGTEVPGKMSEVVDFLFAGRSVSRKAGQKSLQFSQHFFGGSNGRFRFHFSDRNRDLPTGSRRLGVRNRNFCLYGSHFLGYPFLSCSFYRVLGVQNRNPPSIFCNTLA